MTDKKFLNSAYGMKNNAETKELYKDWAQSYEAEVTEQGYATPDRCAVALAQFCTNKSTQVLDVGCGTGMSGIALAKAGFTHVDGSDFSQEMLDLAAQKPGIYQNLLKTDLSEPFPFENGAYGGITAMGVIADAHAPPETIDAILAKLAPGGYFVLSLNDHTLKNPRFLTRICENIDCQVADLMFKEHGPHLPGIGMESSVFVLQKR